MPSPNDIAELTLTVVLSSRQERHATQGDLRYALWKAAAQHEHTGSIYIERDYCAAADGNVMLMQLNGEDIE